MQLIAIGDVIINLDNVTLLDIDGSANPAVVVVHVHRDSNQSVIDVNMPRAAVAGLMNLVPQNLRFPGGDPNN